MPVTLRKKNDTIYLTYENMKFPGLIAAIVTVACVSAAPKADAQYYQIASQLSSLIQPALSGSLNYKGFVELGGTAGLGGNRANFVGISTTQGFTYSDWFFMGAGLGVDVAMSKGAPDDSGNAETYGRGSTRTKAMIPVFSDFRFNIGSRENTSFFIDLKIGAAWLLGSSYLELRDGGMSGQTQFYFKPSLGFRIPVDDRNSSHAINLGLTYQLLTNNSNWDWYNNNITLNNLGFTIGYEW